MRRPLSLVLVAAPALLLAACSGLPTTGPVTPGLKIQQVEDGQQDIIYLPNEPQIGADPDRIVAGFIEAATNPDDRWGVARMFLAPSIRNAWNPRAGVIVDARENRSITVQDDGTVVVRVLPLATVSENGVYSSVTQGETKLEFRLAKQPDGEWRITEAPNGVLMSAVEFRQVYRAYPVMFWSLGWQYLVPDTRWFPMRANPATLIAQVIADTGPSGWLAGAVRTAVPTNVTLAHPSVPIDTQGVATVELSPGAAGLEGEVLARIRAQLSASLAPVGVNSVVLSAGGVPISTEPLLPHSTRIDPRALVRTEHGFGHLGDGELTSIAGLSEVVAQHDVRDITVAITRNEAVALMAEGGVYRLGVDGATVVDEREGLIAPALDPLGYAWTVPATKPQELHATLRGETVDIAGAWPEASAVHALDVSRDGTRIVASLSIGDARVLIVSAIVRDAQGAPVSLGETKRLATLPAAATDVAWLSDSAVGAVGESQRGPYFLSQTVGGPGEMRSAPEKPTHLAGANDPSMVRVLTEDGTLYLSRGSAWQSEAHDILVLAGQLSVTE